LTGFFKVDNFDTGNNKQYKTSMDYFHEITIRNFFVSIENLKKNIELFALRMSIVEKCCNSSGFTNKLFYFRNIQLDRGR
jgi:hypothetical protein